MSIDNPLLIYRIARPFPLTKAYRIPFSKILKFFIFYRDTISSVISSRAKRILILITHFSANSDNSLWFFPINHQRNVNFLAERVRSLWNFFNIIHVRRTYAARDYTCRMYRKLYIQLLYFFFQTGPFRSEQKWGHEVPYIWLLYYSNTFNSTLTNSMCTFTELWSSREF